MTDEPADPIQYEQIQISRHLGRGIVVDEAPEHAKAYIGIIAGTEAGVRLDDGGVRIADQVLYEITGYEPADGTLTLRLVHDWRPGQKDDPHGEPTGDLDVTPFLVVHRYRRDQGDHAWLYRCWGDGGCDGFLSLDWSSRDTAEREARAHLAGHPADATVKEG